ncbi:BapA/Bap/LapF family large adhesin [Psychrobacter sp.]|uniref:BapA/Bap/LapF family large adhesin n=1 Tax=Psychrobacter sp. TaxID=56811 RepID=UPI0035647CF8
MSTITVKVNAQTTTITEHKVVTQNGKPTIIKAVDKVNYELIDETTGRAPNHIVTKRIDKALHISFEDNNENPDLIIEGFYDNVDSALIGIAEDGSYYYYIPDSGEVGDYVTELQSGEMQGQALGGNPQVAPWWIGATEAEGFNALPWLAGLAGIGVLGAALGSSGGSNNNDNQPPIDTEAPDAPTDVAVSGDGSTVTGKGEPDTNVKITDTNGSLIGEGVVNANGDFTVTLVPPLVNGEQIDATLTDKAGNESDPTNAAAPDLTAPDAPTSILVGNDDGFLNAEEIGADNTVAVVIGLPETAKAGDTVIVNGKEQRLTLDDITAKKVTVNIAAPAEGDSLTITATIRDVAGNQSQALTKDLGVVDTEAPDAPTDVAVSGDGSTVTGKGEPDTNVKITDSNGTLIGEGVVDANGDFTVTLVPPLVNGEQIDATLTDKAGNESDPTNAAAPDLTAPDAPTSILVGNDDGFLNAEEIGADNTVAVVIGLPETAKAGDTVIVNGKEQRLTLDDITAKKVTVNIAAPAEGDSLTITATLKDVAGNQSQALTKDLGVVDTEAPGGQDGATQVAPVVAIPEAENGVNAQEMADGIQTQVTLPTGTLEGDSITLTVTPVDGGAPIQITHTVTGPEAAAGFSEVTIPNDLNGITADGGYTIVATVTDKAGNSSAPSIPVDVTVDTIAPDAPTTAPIVTDNVANDGSGDILNPPEIIQAGDVTNDNTPSITIPAAQAAKGTPQLIVDGKVVPSIAVTNPDNGNVTLTPQVALAEGKHDLSYNLKDAAGNVSESAPVVTVTVDTIASLTVNKPIAGDNIVNADEAAQGFKVTGTGTAGDTITLTYGTNGKIGTAIVGANGKWSIAVTQIDVANMNQGLETLTITAKDPAGNVSSETADITIVPADQLTITSPIAGDDIVNAEEADTGFNVTGTGVVGDTITLTNQAGDIIGIAIVDENNKWSIPVAPQSIAAMGEGLETLTAKSTSSADVTSATINIDTIAPDASTTEIIVDNVTADNVINAIEAEGNIAVTGSVTGDYSEGDAVKITVNGIDYTGVVDLAGKFSIEVPGVELVADADKAIDVSVTATDAAGNTGTVNTTKEYTVNTDEIIAAADNFVDFQITATPLEIKNDTPSDLNKTGFTVVGASLGPVLGAGVVADVVKNSVVLNVGEDQVREVTVQGNAGGVQVAGTMNLNLYKLNESTNEWELQAVKENWVVSYLLGGVSKEANFSLDEGQWLFVMSGNEGISALTGYTLKFLEDTVLDYSQATAVSGSVTGNILADDDASSSYDELPVGTTVTSITSSNGAPQTLESGETTIEGQYGTLTISPDGSYEYRVNEDFRGPYGSEESFTYTITSPDGNTASAELNIQLNILPVDKQIKIDQSLIVDVEPTVILDTTDSEIKDAVGFGVLDLSFGSSSVLDLELLGGKPPLEFTVGDNQVRELTLHGSGGGVDIAKTYSMAVYKLDENTGQYVQVHFEKNWFNVPFLGGKSDPLTLSFGAGDYKAVLLTAGGVGVLSGNGLYVDRDIIYDYDQPSKFMGEITGDATPDAGKVILKVGEESVTSDTPVTYQGKYGQLTIEANGDYTYSVNNNASDPNWQPPYGAVDSFRLVTKDANGKAAVETLNIKISTHTAVDDFNEVAVQTQNTVTNITFNEPDKVGNYGKSYTKEFEIAEHDAAAPVIIEATARSTNIAFGDNVTITYTLLNTTTGQRFTGSVKGTKAGASLSDSLPDLPAGSYTLTITTNKGNLQSIGFDTTVIHSEDYSASSPAEVTGVLLGNDAGIGNISELKVGSKSVFISDPNQGAKSIDIEGLYGTLTVNKDGSYSYLPNGESFGIERFTYETVSVTGVKETATLEINVGKTVTASIHNDVAVSSAANDSFIMGAGADTLVFDNLGTENGGNGNNGLDIWSDFSAAQGDQIDITGLLDGNQTAANIGNYLKYQDGVLMVDRNGNAEYEALLQVAATDLTELLGSIKWQVAGANIASYSIGAIGKDTVYLDDIYASSSHHLDEGSDTFTLTGSGQTISLSDFFETDVIDISGTAANTLNIGDEDVTGAEMSNPIYVRGDSDDTVNLQGSDWSKTGQTVNDNTGQTYDVWQIDNNLSSQVYIDTEIANII